MSQNSNLICVEYEYFLETNSFCFLCDFKLGADVQLTHKPSHQVCRENLNLLISSLVLQEERGRGFPHMGYIHVGICTQKSMVFKLFWS